MKGLLQIFILFPIACLAQKRLMPVEYNPSSHSETYSVIRSERFTIYAECLDARKDLLVFDIEIVNESGWLQSVYPDQFYIFGSSGPFPATGKKNQEDIDTNKPLPFSVFYAQSERTIAGYYQRRIRKKENTKTLLALIGAGLMLFDVVQDGQDFYREPTPKRISRSISRDVAVGTSLIAINAASELITSGQAHTDEDAYYLQEEFLRTGIVNNGESVRGKAFFLPDRKYTFYRLTLPMQNEVYVFDFRWR